MDQVNIIRGARMGDREVVQYLEYRDKKYRAYVDYNEGGMNYFTGNVEKRQFELGVTPTNISLDEGGNLITISIRMFSGIRIGVMPVKRFSRKKLDQLAELYLFGDGYEHEKTVQLLEEVAIKNGQ